MLTNSCVLLYFLWTLYVTGNHHTRHVIELASDLLLTQHILKILKFNNRFVETTTQLYLWYSYLKKNTVNHMISFFLLFTMKLRYVPEKFYFTYFHDIWYQIK